MLDAWLYGEQPKDLPGLQSYWENFYHQLDDNIVKYDVHMTFFQSFTRQATKKLTNAAGCRFTPIWKTKEAHYYMNKDVLQGITVLYDVKYAPDEDKRDLGTLETLVKLRNTTVLYNKDMGLPGNRLKGLDVS